MKYMLVVVFYLSGPEPQFGDGFLPRFFDTQDQCEERRQEAQEFFTDLELDFELNCYEMLPKGVSL